MQLKRIERGKKMKKNIALAILTAASSIALAMPAMADYESDLDVLSRIISAEAGYCSWDMMISVGSVVLNRVEDSRFPYNIYDVVFAPGQYSPTINGVYYNEPTADAVEAAAYLLENGSQIDESVVWQANFPQGNGIYDTISTSYSTMYFCF